MNAALRQTGGAAGVVERGGVVQIQPGQVLRSGICGSQCGHQVDAVGDGQFGCLQQVRYRNRRLGRAEFGQAGGEHLLQRGLLANLSYHRQQLVEADDGAGATVVELIAQLHALGHRADRGVDRAHLENAVESDMQLRAVGHEHRDPVSRLDTLGLQQGGATVAQVIQLGVGQLVTIEMHGNPVRRGARPVGEIFGQRSFTLWVDGGGRFACRPDLCLNRLEGVEIVLLVHVRASCCCYRSSLGAVEADKKRSIFIQNHDCYSWFGCRRVISGL